MSQEDMAMDLSLDALSLMGIFLLVLFVVLLYYLCTRRGNSCKDTYPPGGSGD
jgi:hypothetical protein